MSTEKANIFSDMEISRSELKFSKDYDSDLDINIMNENAIAFKAGNYVFEAHVSDADTVDYTVYKDNFDEIDGGQIECNLKHFSIRELIDYIYLPFNAHDLTLLDHESLEEML